MIEKGLCQSYLCQSASCPTFVLPHLAKSQVTVRVQARVAHAGAKFARTSKHATWDAKISEERNFALFK